LLLSGYIRTIFCPNNITLVDYMFINTSTTGQSFHKNPEATSKF